MINTSGPAMTMTLVTSSQLSRNQHAVDVYAEALVTSRYECWKPVERSCDEQGCRWKPRGLTL
jgi:hypothetical protein